MYQTIKQQLKHLSKTEYETLRELCHVAKNLMNEALYNVRQHFFAGEGYLNYYSNYKLLKTSVNYKKLNSNMSQQILKEVDGSFKSFFALHKLAKRGSYDMSACHIPHYLPKDGYTTLVISMVRINDGVLTIPYSRGFRKTHADINIHVPPNLSGKEVKEIRIIPKSNARFFEIQYCYQVDEVQRNLNTDRALAIDLGVDNLVTGVSSDGSSFIIDGRRLKSINQWYNKENARLQSIKDKQNLGKGLTFRQAILLRNRNNAINDYLNKTVRTIINKCISWDIGTIVLGYNNGFQRNSKLGKRNNQNFVNIPFGKLKDKLQYLCQMNSIHFVMQEESYTSKASFWDKDMIPTYLSEDINKYTFSGLRVKRGLYRRADGKLFNADVNGALNILRKSSVVDLVVLYSRGDVATPMRIRIA